MSSCLGRIRMKGLVIKVETQPHLEINDIVRINYFRRSGGMAEVDARVVGGKHPHYTIEFTIDGEKIRAVTDEVDSGLHREWFPE